MLQEQKKSGLEETRQTHEADRFAVDGIRVDDALRSSVIDQMARHSSVRSFDSGRPMPAGLTSVLVAAAQSGSTSSNFQSWSVVEVVDPERKQHMRKLCDDQAFIEEAPLFLAFCADVYRHKWVTNRQGYPFGSDYLELLLVSVIDSAIACQNAALAAESLGLGCCMVGAIRNRPRDVAEYLGLPKGVFATIGLAVGYPADRNEVKPRLPQRAIWHRERYSAESLEEAAMEYDERMAKTSIYEGRRVVVDDVTPAPEDDTDHYGWIEHTARRMARGNYLRRDLADFLRSHGFVLD